jgi:acetyltransferase-like isoleucine patch superfamily enzyme
VGCFEEITIGNDVRCGANTTITDSDWHLNDPRVGSPKPVTIMDNVWLGLNSVVLKGVTIGRNSIIGASSVVVRDVPPDVIAAGNPCQVIRTLKNDGADRQGQERPE